MLGLLLSLWISKLIHDKQELQAITELDNQLEGFVRKVDVELISSGEVLFSISNLHNAVERFTPEIFNKFTKKLIQRKKSILIIEWQPIVQESERDSFIKNARAMGLKDFDLWEIDKNGNSIKASKRAVHVPVLFANSTERPAQTAGLDLAFSPERMNSKWESADTGNPRASETFNVIVSATQKTLPTGFAITAPVFDRGTESSTLEERKKNIFGFVAAVFDVEKLLLPPIESLDKKNIDFKIVDLKNNKIVLERNSGKPWLISRSMKMDVYGRDWNVFVFAGENFVNTYTSKWEYVYSFVIALLFGILYLFLEINRKKSIALIETQEKLKIAVVKAEAAAHAKTMFLANMSHELRTPLASILGYAKLIKRDSDTAKRSEQLDIIIRNGKHLTEVINDILDISKLEESKLKLNPKPFNLNDLINQLDELVVSHFRKSNVQYIKKIDPNIEETLIGDQFRIKQILINLLSNAFKFTDQGQIILSVEKTNGDENRYYLNFTISDTGIGMSLDFQKNIFDPFTQEEISVTRGHGGTGLGLSIAFRLVKLMGGRISLKSEQNKGTTFYITLPFEK